MSYYLTAGKLRDIIKDLPDETPILVQRIEDEHFDNYSWTVDKIVMDGESLLLRQCIQITKC